MRKVIYDESVNGITVNRLIRDAEFSMPNKHTHNEYEIYYLIDGERFYNIGTESFHIKAGSLVFINRHMVHRTAQVQDEFYHERAVLEFTENPFSTFLSTTNELSLSDFYRHNRLILNLNTAEQKKVLNQLNQIAQIMKKKPRGFQLLVMTELAKIHLFALDIIYSDQGQKKLQSGFSSASNQRVQEVIDYISEHFRNNLALEDLSQHFYINKSYLSRIFKEVTGHTVHEFINVTRIRHAQDLLINSELNIAEIAENLGYNSVPYFVKTFRKYTETSPLKYRKHNLRFTNPTRSKSFENDY